MLSIGLWRWFINITTTILGIIHRPVSILTQLYRFVRTSQDMLYVSATSPMVNAIYRLFVMLVFKVYFVLFPKATKGLEPISYRGVLLRTLLRVIAYDVYRIC
jgi:hypothetical protein